MEKKKAKSVKKSKTSAKSSSKPRSKLILGKAVPNFKVLATGGKTIQLKELKSKKIVLFFYPKDMTPGCTIEGHEFTKLKPDFEDKNTLIFGVSRDSISSHEKFKEKECYTIDLLSDEDEALCKLFGVIKMKNMYGKKVRGIERSTFVLDESGKLIQEWRGVKAESHAQTVLDYIRSMS
jgi:peroxiredoxin Q/BCP